MTKLSPEAQALLDQGRDALTPSTATKERVLSSLDTSLASGAGVAGASAFAGGKLWLALTLMAGIGGGFLLFRSSGDAPKQVSAPVAAVENVAPEPAPELPLAPPEPESPAVEPVVVPETPVAKSEPIFPRTKKNTKKVTNKPNDLLAERKLIAGAQSAIRDKKYAEARALLAEHEKQFARGVLRPERQAAQAIANCLDENGESGKAIARRFLAAYPSSPLAPRVRKSCELGEP